VEWRQEVNYLFFATAGHSTQPQKIWQCNCHISGLADFPAMKKFTVTAFSHKTAAFGFAALWGSIFINIRNLLPTCTSFLVLLIIKNNLRLANQGKTVRIERESVELENCEIAEASMCAHTGRHTLWRAY